MDDSLDLWVPISKQNYTVLVSLGEDRAIDSH